jgi:hypothetical protein
LNETFNLQKNEGGSMNYLYKITILAFVICIILQFGCAKRSMVPFNELPVPSEIELSTTDGQKIKAIARQKSSNTLFIQRQKMSEVEEIEKSQIQTIHYYPPQYDESGGLITKEEIAREKNNKNAVIYTIGGGALSFGASLFISSLAYRGSDDDFKVVNPISIGGGILGTGLLFWQGGKRDNMLALERIKDQRQFMAEDELEEKRAEREKLQKQLDELKKEKARVEEEKKKIQEKLKKKKKKKSNK